MADDVVVVVVVVANSLDPCSNFLTGDLEEKAVAVVYGQPVPDNWL